MPGAHKSKQLSCEELPGGEVFPPAHIEHVSLPLSLLYVPASHSVQSPPSGPVYPALHLQSVMESLPAVDQVWVGHEAHTSAFSYVPPSHTTHAWPLLPEYPGSQTQSVMAVLACGDCEPVGQV